MICCHQLDKVVSWNILYIAIVQNNTRNMSQFFCWNEMFYQEIRQMSKLPPKSRWWGMGPMKRITTIWLESRKSIFAKKRKPWIQTWEQERAQDENCKKNQPKRNTLWKRDLRRIFLIQCKWGSTSLIWTETANIFMVKLCLAWNKNLPPK